MKKHLTLMTVALAACVAIIAPPPAEAVTYVLISPGTNLVNVMGYTNSSIGTNVTVASMIAFSNAATVTTPAGSTVTRTFNGSWITQPYATNGVTAGSYSAFSNALPSALSSPALIGGGYFPIDVVPDASREMAITVAGQYVTYVGATNPLSYTLTFASSLNPSPVPIGGFGTNALSSNVNVCTNFIYPWVTNYYQVAWLIPSNTVNFCFTTNLDMGAVGYFGLYSDALATTNTLNPYGFITNLFVAVEIKRKL